ncbi:MAG TPA: ferritin-like domain-containing protein [Solirubrobacteraceae bacterium]|jgi:rubrerythrin|nr:ferritin-like domain-containing protein [Solirubrobacteraceae bacterium]
MPSPTRTDQATQEPAGEASPQPAGIVERLVRDDVDRKRFLKMAGATGAASFGAFVLAACGSSSSSSTKSAATATATTTSASSSSGDVAILNYALTLEYLESEFYSKVIAANLFSGKVGELLQRFGSQEDSHVTALKAAVSKLGGTPVEDPHGKFPIKSAPQVALLAYTVENLGAAAYLGQAAKIQSPEVLASALAIHSVEARHAATLGTLVKKSVTPQGAFATPAEMSTVLAAVKPFLG